jgi:MFS family permease
MTTTEITAGAISESEYGRQLRRAIIASTVGTTIEWYDFLLYSVVTGLVFGKLFFPESDPLLGMLQAFAVYTVGFIARPIGAAIFGHYGDRIGRKAALITTLLLTGLATFAVGFVPTYEPPTPGGNSSIGRWRLWRAVRQDPRGSACKARNNGTEGPTLWQAFIPAPAGG